MDDYSSFYKGFQFAAELVNSVNAANVSEEYINSINNEINKLAQNLQALNSNQSDAVLGGFAAEEWHAGTFNIDAVSNRSDHRYYVNRSEQHLKNSVDLKNNFGGKEYSSKYYFNAEESVKQQAKYDHDLKQAAYHNQERLVPEDQLEAGKAYAQKQYLRNKDIRPDVADSYKETGEHLTDIISDNEGNQSKPMSKKGIEETARDIKNGELDLAKNGVTAKEYMKENLVLQDAFKAGVSAATLTVVLQVTPEIMKCITYLVNTGELDIDQLKHTGLTAIGAVPEGFFRGSLSSSLMAYAKAGFFGKALTNMTPDVLGAMVTITMQTVKNGILVASGNMTSQEMANQFVDSAITTSLYISGSKLGGAIGQAFAPELPVLGFLIGSLIGSSCAVIYGIGKQQFISLCVDTGFTCFGLVEQDYTLPEEILKQLDIDLIPIDYAEVSYADIDTINLDYNEIKAVPYDTIGYTMVKRGVIGVNKIGYIG